MQILGDFGFGRLAIAGFDNHFLGKLQSHNFVYFRQIPILYSVNLVATQVGLWGIRVDILGEICSKQLQFEQLVGNPWLRHSSHPERFVLSCLGL
jgi:hypothetical protein